MMEWKRKIGIGLFSLFFLFSGISAWAEEMYLVPIGKTVGVTLDMKGVTIVDTTDVEDYDGKRHTPAKDASFRSGDSIISINGVAIQSAKHLEEVVNTQGDQEMEIVFERQNQIRQTKAKAALSNKDGHYRLGIWIKDAASGIGTVTYYNPATKEFGALGHGISEDADEILPIQGGELWKASVVSVQKGSRGQPGELIGVFAEGNEKLGEVSSNTEVGLKGILTHETESISDAIPIATRSEVQEGEAEILSNIEEDKIEAFSVKIQKINKDPNNTKGMIVKVIDEKLLEKTGGIVQGMSGSPIVQNGKLVGAITHVLVNDPTRGYGIFIENMLSKVK